MINITQRETRAGWVGGGGGGGGDKNQYGMCSQKHTKETGRLFINNRIPQ